MPGTHMVARGQAKTAEGQRWKPSWESSRRKWEGLRENLHLPRKSPPLGSLRGQLRLKQRCWGAGREARPRERQKCQRQHCERQEESQELAEGH